MMKRYLLTRLAAAGLALSATTTAASAQVTLGVTGPNNNVIGAATGYYGADVWLFGGPNTTIDVFFLGVEAGFKNSFKFAGTTYGWYGGGANTGLSSLFGGSYNPVFLGSKSVSSGLLDFSFITPLGTIFNGSNPPQGSGSDFWSAFYTCDTAQPLTACNFGTGSTATSGNTLLLALDDGGAGIDDNHDDLVMALRINRGIVPEPSSIALLSAGLVGLGVIARRRREA